MILYFEVHSFTQKIFHGNPAGVCPLDHWIDEKSMQRIAAENNLSETAFFVPKENHYEIRWFTPTVEVDLCGHATLATAFVLFDHLGYEGDAIVFESKSGELTVWKENDFLIIEGAGHTGVGSVLGFSNARVAKIADAPVVMVTGGGVGNVVDSAYMNLALFEKEQADVRAVLVNKIIPEKREKTLRYLELAFAKETFKVVGGFNYQPILANPTLRRISQVLDVPLHGNQEAAGQIAHHVQIGSAATQRVTELLKESSLVTVTSSRDELLVTLANMYNLPEYRYLLAGLVIPGVAKISAITQKILDNSGIPYMRTTRTTADVFNTITDDVSKLNAMDTQKINLIMELADKRFEFDALDSLLG